MIEWSTVLGAGVKAILPKIIEGAIKGSTAAFQQSLPYKNINFENHFDYAFERCTKIKTIVNGDIPVDLLQSYVSPDFVCGNSKRIDEYTFIESIWNNRHTTLVGSAGAGKSMFMRYFWISCLINPRNKIPIFIELRKFNEISTIDFGLFCQIIATQNSSGEAQRLFSKAVEEGQFVFVLDGLDELNDDRRSHVEKWILSVDYSKNVILVSSRPDISFDAWQSFLSFRVLPMTLTQTTKLIQRIDFNHTVKQKFIKELKGGLYEKHQTFASRPLLATMMLLTFSSFADMPEKIHVFYDQAFDTLFSRHDATKEAFKRERSTSFSIDAFKRYLALLSLITYNENKTEFSESEILERITKVGIIEEVNIDSTNFLRDLLNCVCILQREGSFISYSHRSFQEYFTSY